MKFYSFKKFVVYVSSIVFVSALGADIVILKSGKQINCKVFAQSKKNVRCRLTTGKKITYAKKLIRRIRYGSFPDAKAIQREKDKSHRLARLKRIKEEQLEKKRQESLRLAEQKREKEEKIEQDRKNAEDNKKAALVTPSDALWRSAILPGWGQVARGDTWRGAGLGSGFLVALGGVLSYKSSYNNAKSAYDESVQNALMISEFSGLAGLLMSSTTVTQNQQSMQQSSQGFQASVVILSSFYIYNLFDAWFFTQGATANVKDAHEQQGFVFNLGLDSNHNQSRVANHVMHRKNHQIDSNLPWDRLDLRYVFRF